MSPFPSSICNSRWNHHSQYKLLQYHNRNKNPNYVKPIKLSQYADDSNFPIKEQNSAEKVMSFSQKLNKASGATTNFEKTKILPINTDQITRTLATHDNKEQYEAIRF